MLNDFRPEVFSLFIFFFFEKKIKERTKIYNLN